MKLIEQRRQGAIFFLHHLSLSATSKGYSMTKYCPKDIGFMKGSCSQDEIRWLLNEEDLSSAGKDLIQKIRETPQYFNTMAELFEESCELNNNYCDSISKIRPGVLTIEEIFEKMEKGFDFYQKIWSRGLFMEEIDFHLSPILKTNLKEKGFEEKEAQKTVTILTTQKEDTFSRSAEKNILKIAEYIQGKKQNEIKTIKSKEVKKMIEEHYNNYYWSACNYFSFSGLGKESIVELVKSTLQQKKKAEKTLNEMKEQENKTIEEKELLKQKYNFDKNTLLNFHLMESVGIYYDKRKKAQMHIFFSLGRLLKEIARRKKTDFDLVKYLFPYELKDFFMDKISKETLVARRKYTFIDYNKTPIKILVGEEARKTEEAYWHNTDLSKNQYEISGLCASEGSVIAKARVITSAKYIGELKEGEILVTGMTTPDYVPALKKIAGIITDDGGITCHAAIITREMKIPCIVGTKTATRKINTGDLIDLRAHHGMARIIQTAKTQKTI
jgi:phosphohistidine swiveling domain-containing protein